MLLRFPSYLISVILRCWSLSLREVFVRSNRKKFGSEIKWIKSKVPVAVEMLIDIKDIIDLILR